jgi:hypothetical protein
MNRPLNELNSLSFFFFLLIQLSFTAPRVIHIQFQNWLLLHIGTRSLDVGVVKMPGAFVSTLVAYLALRSGHNGPSSSFPTIPYASFNRGRFGACYDGLEVLPSLPPGSCRPRCLLTTSTPPTPISLSLTSTGDIRYSTYKEDRPQHCVSLANHTAIEVSTHSLLDLGRRRRRRAAVEPNPFRKNPTPFFSTGVRHHPRPARRPPARQGHRADRARGGGGPRPRDHRRRGRVRRGGGGEPRRRRPWPLQLPGTHT